MRGRLGAGGEGGGGAFIIELFLDEIETKMPPVYLGRFLHYL